MDLTALIKPELLVLVPILAVLGSQLKRAPKYPDWMIPFTLELVGICLATLWVAATGKGSFENVLWMGITQGFICALVAVGAHQTWKQVVKEADTDG